MAVSSSDVQRSVSVLIHTVNLSTCIKNTQLYSQCTCKSVDIRIKGSLDSSHPRSHSHRTHFSIPLSYFSIVFWCKQMIGGRFLTSKTHSVWMVLQPAKSSFTVLDERLGACESSVHCRQMKWAFPISTLRKHHKMFMFISIKHTGFERSVQVGHTWTLTSAPLLTRNSRHRAPWVDAAAKWRGVKPLLFGWLTFAP